MNLFVEHIDDALVVCPKGQLNSANAAEFEADILARLATGAARLILDLSGLDYISSAGLRVVLVAAQTVREQGGVLILCGLSGAVHEVFEVSGFLDILSIREDKTCALNVKAPARAAPGG